MDSRKSGLRKRSSRSATYALSPKPPEIAGASLTVSRAQPPSSGWGSAQQLTDPHYATTAFLKTLTQQPDWQHKPLTDAAQTVQVSAFGDRYAQWEKQAADLVQTQATK